MNKESITILKAINGDIYSLAGPHNKKLRQELIYQLTGDKKPIAKCGIHAIELIICNLINPENNSGYCTIKTLQEFLSNC